jgi:hypothetical protein
MTIKRLTLATGNARAPLSERGDDLYETPAVAVEALLEHEQLPAVIWEPACGSGAIVKVLRRHGQMVVASDLNDCGCPDSTSRVDFLMESHLPTGVEAIITNPPFKLAHQFMRHALALCPRVVMLGRLAWLESQERSDVLENAGLARVHVFSRRIPMMHRHGWNGRRIGNSGMAFAWFVWDRAHQGPATVQRISWRDPTPDLEPDLALDSSQDLSALTDEDECFFKGRTLMPARLHLTSVDSNLDYLVRTTPPGAMAHWAGTGPDGATCGQCKHFGYSAPIRTAAGNSISSVKKSNCCRLYWLLMRRHGNPLPPTTASCKHFTPREG